MTGRRLTGGSCCGPAPAPPPSCSPAARRTASRLPRPGAPTTGSTGTTGTTEQPSTTAPSTSAAPTPTTVPAPPSTVPAGAVEDLRRRLSGNVITPLDASYPAAGLPANTRYPATRPAVIASCRDEADVVTCVQWAVENGVPPVGRGGGHSYAGLSTTNGLLIDISALNAVDARPVDRHRPGRRLGAQRRRAGQDHQRAVAAAGWRRASASGPVASCSAAASGTTPTGPG